MVEDNWEEIVDYCKKLDEYVNTMAIVKFNSTVITEVGINGDCINFYAPMMMEPVAQYTKGQDFESLKSNLVFYEYVGHALEL